MTEEKLRKLGLNVNNLDEDDINRLSTIIDKIRQNMRPEELSNLFRQAGIEPQKLLSKLRNSNQKIRDKIGRNEKCPCGSGKKYKKCCLK